MNEAIPVVFDEEELDDIVTEWFDDNVEEVDIHFLGITEASDPERFPAVANKFENKLLLFPAKSVSQMTAWLDESVFERTLVINATT